ncbi:hypothetical protein C8Q74DRAFT_330341 [Fomes fomentarius]|nr:hypothetical protein C8Q74DRAFT_330341 [Fomes fomentarius]
MYPDKTYSRKSRLCTSDGSVSLRFDTYQAFPSSQPKKSTAAPTHTRKTSTGCKRPSLRAKRARPYSRVRTAPQPRARLGGLVADGSVVRIPHNTAFWVHKKLLSEHLPVFRDLFQIPQPPDAHKIEECSVVMLSDHPWQFCYLFSSLVPNKGHLTHVFPRQRIALYSGVLTIILRAASGGSKTRSIWTPSVPASSSRTRTSTT